MSDEIKVKNDAGEAVAQTENDAAEVEENVLDQSLDQSAADTDLDGDMTVEAIDETQALSEDNLKAQLEAANIQVEEFKDQYLRAKADNENTRRRAQTDVANARKFAVEEFAREMLNVKDSLDLARNVELSEADSEAVKKMLEGLDLTLRQMDAVFERFSLQVIDPAPGDKFDPEWHQAMTMQESADIPANHIVLPVQKGFTLHERLLRPAMVIVAKAASNDENTENG